MAGASAEYFLANEQWQRQNDLGTRTAGIDALLQGQVTQLTNQKKELEGKLEKEQNKSQALTDELAKLRPKVSSWEEAENAVPILQRKIAEKDKEIAALSQELYELRHPKKTKLAPHPRTLEDELSEIAKEGLEDGAARYVSNKRFSLVAIATTSLGTDRPTACKLSITDTLSQSSDDETSTKPLTPNQTGDLTIGSQKIRVILRGTSFGIIPPTCYFDFFILSSR